LPLRGKILNVEKATTSKMLENAEIKTIIAALGVGIGKENFDLEKLRYHKIIIMTDADVDGSHIRTLLMTFFFKHMRSLIQLGHVYLAQPPLFLVKKGKNHTYLKTEKDLENYLLKRIGEEVVLFYGPNGEDGDEEQIQQLKGRKLVTFIKLINKMESLMESIEKRGMPRVLTEKLIELIKSEDTFEDEDQTRQIAQSISQVDCAANVDISFDREHSRYTLELEYELNGVIMHRSINWDYLTGPLFAKVNETYEKLKEYPDPPYRFKIGNEELEIEHKKELVSILFEKIKKGLTIQRYKGLGEMNPGQLWETTMDPKNRTLLKVNINDFFACETIFDTLMGSDSGKRKEFILENALNVRNLDI
ncbi:MAG: DNA gyrase subunit B, partial [Candidatus Aminicenantes bacterium]